MAYSALATAVTGDLWTAANHNTYIKDNFAASVPDIFTAAGDIAYATGANAASPLAIGTARQGLFVNSGATAPEWHSPLFGCDLSLTTDQTIGNNTETKVIFDTETYDTEAMWSTDNTDAVTIPYDGVFQCTGRIQWAAGSLARYVYIGGTLIEQVTSPGSAICVQDFIYINRFTTGTDVYLSVEQESGGNLALTAVEYQVTYLGAST